MQKRFYRTILLSRSFLEPLISLDLVGTKLYCFKARVHFYHWLYFIFSANPVRRSEELRGGPPNHRIVLEPFLVPFDCNTLLLPRLSLIFKAQPTKKCVLRYRQSNVRRLLQVFDYCRALFRCLNCTQRFDYSPLGSIGRALNFRVRMLVKGPVISEDVLKRVRAAF